MISIKILKHFNLPKFILLILIICSNSCSQVAEKQSNIDIKKYSELEKVLDHFKADTCIEKLLAAEFIVENIQGKYAKYVNGVDTVIKKCVAFKRERKKKYKNLSMKVTKGLFINNLKDVDLSTSKVYDINSIQSDFLIKHVNNSYAEWQKMQKVNTVNFSDFCDYILPYRVDNEKIEDNAREIIKQNYKWVSDSLLSGGDIKYILTLLVDSVGFEVKETTKKKINAQFSLLQVHQLKFGACFDGVVYFANILRSLGIPAAMDYIPQWGSHHFTGHSICAIKWKGEWVKLNVGAVGNRFISKKYYYNHSVPKVLRKTYSASKSLYNINRFSIDVTDEYKPVTDFEVKLPISKMFNQGIPALAIFNKSLTYRVICLGERSLLKLHFNDLGTNCLYFPGIINGSGFISIGNPVYIDSLSKKTVLEIDSNSLQTVQLKRKYPYVIYRYAKKKGWLDNLKNCYLEGADNESFIGSKKLLTMGTVTAPYLKNYKLNTTEKFKYIRFKNDDSLEVSIAHIDFLNKSGHVVKGKPLYGKYFPNNVPRASDNNPLTFYWGWKDFYFGYEFEEPQYIASINFQPRNDGNHINKGDVYALMYWDKEWVSLKTQIAKDHFLEFDSVPKNALLWLKNLTKGVEELPFFMDENGQQYWPGSIPDTALKPGI